MGYSGNPQTTPLDAVRFLIHDTTSPFVVSDSEILFALDNEQNSFLAAAFLLDHDVSRQKGVRSKTIGGLSISWGGVEEASRAAAMYRARGSAHQLPTLADTTAASKKALFEIGQFDNLQDSGESD